METQTPPQPQSATRMMTGAQIVIEALKEHGVDVIFGYPGGLSCQYMMRCSKRTRFIMSLSGMSRGPDTRLKAMPGLRGERALLWSPRGLVPRT